MHLDRILVVLIVLLLASVAAFLSGLLPYPLGFIILSIFIVARILHLQGKQ
ncbi:MAG: hypothetical protein HKP57_11650 [Halobacteria archaeon]|nr:hypothetical protein [Halobacteria archaeon]